MKRSGFVALASVLVALLSGCSTVPPGFTRAEWNSLTPKQQAKYASLQRTDRTGFISQISSVRSDADSTLRSLNPNQPTLSSDPSSTR